jgi:hypothetical protein
MQAAGLAMRYSFPIRYGSNAGSFGNAVTYGYAPTLIGHYPIGEPPAPTQQPAPVFRFDCSAGCLFPPLICQSILRQAIVQACRMALNAARKLEANPRDSATVNSFRSIFGHDPAQPLPWPRIKDSGIRFANRFRSVEQALLKAGTLYRCDPCTAQSRYEINAPTIILDVHAMAIPPNEVRLCPSFWQLPGLLQAGVVLHEMFHLRFDPCFGHGATETKRTNAYCYEAFALSFTSQKPEPLTIQKCNASPP